MNISEDYKKSLMVKIVVLGFRETEKNKYKRDNIQIEFKDNGSITITETVGLNSEETLNLIDSTAVDQYLKIIGVI